MIKWRQQSGTVSVEMAAMLPILILLTLGAVDLGRLFYVTVTVANAARAGVSYGSLNKQRSKNLDKSHEFGHADADSVQGGVAVNATRFCECSDGSSVDCETGTCDEGSKSIYVRVRAWKTYQTLLPYPGIPNSVAMVRDAYMQAGTR